MENNHHFAAFAQQQLQQQQQQQQPQMLAQDQQPNCTNQSQSNDGGIEAGQQQQTQSSDLQQQSQQPPQQQQQQQPQQQQQQLGTNSVRPDQQFFGGMNMSNFANFTQGFQMMQQPGQLGVTNPFGNMPASLMGATPLQQQLSALSGLTGQIQNHDGSNPFQANGFQGLQPAGLQTLQQMGFQPSVQQNQLQQQQSFFPGGFNPHFIPAVQAPQQAQQPTQQQQQLTPSQGAMMATAPQVGLNLQQLQQLMTQQLFAQQPGMPAGFNLSSLTGMTPAGMQASAPVPATVGVAPTLLPQQLASLAGMFGAQQVAMQQPATQHVFSNGINGISVPPVSSIALPGLPTNKQDGETDGGVKSPPEAEWAEPFAGKGKKEPPFPLKLHQILSNPEFSECICWNTHGRSWRILKPPVFEQVVIPLYFRHAKYASFMRQVNGWGFKRIVSGNDHNSYYHEMFVREFPQLCLKMKRIRKGEAEKARKESDSHNSDKDDDSKDEGSAKDEEEPSANGQTIQASTYTSAQSALQSLQATGLLGQTAPNSGNEAALNFLKASGFATLMGNQQPPAMNAALNGQNFLQGLIMAGGGGNSLPGLNFGQQGGPVVGNYSSGGQAAVAASGATTSNQTSSASPQSLTPTSQTRQPGPGGAQLGGAPAGPYAAFAGVDNAALTKLQEAIAAAGGAGMFVQQNSQLAASNPSTTIPAGGGSTTSNETETATNAAAVANNAFASLFNSQFGGHNASLLAAQFQAATQQRIKSEEDGETNA